jgi:Zn-dependent M28 family amino/carboxypeptidase
MLFASVAAEEQGLLGSRYLAEHLPLESGRLLADINVDGLNLLGRTRDIVAIGQGKSNLDDYVQALARMQERTLVPDPFPDRGSFYRSDQFSFARLGVPAAYVKGGTDVVGRPAGWGKQQREEFESNHYHKPSDELRADWDYSGALEDGRLLFYLGLKIANAARKPAWKPGDEFEAARKLALAKIGE